MQTKESGAQANALGHLAAKLIGDAIGAQKTSETSNEFDYQGKKVAIKIARQGTTNVGVILKEQKKYDDALIYFNKTIQIRNLFYVRAKKFFIFDF